MNRKEMLIELMAVDFARFDLRLFLNTHPYDKEAIADYNELTRQSDSLRQEFESAFGPISHNSVSDEDCFLWIEEPWPWERSFLDGNTDGDNCGCAKPINCGCERPIGPMGKGVR